MTQKRFSEYVTKALRYNSSNIVTLNTRLKSFGVTDYAYVLPLVDTKIPKESFKISAQVTESTIILFIEYKKKFHEFKLKNTHGNTLQIYQDLYIAIISWFIKQKSLGEFNEILVK